ncbi:hypothetical protein ABK040_001289 [Willaertia magna]
MVLVSSHHQPTTATACTSSINTSSNKLVKGGKAESTSNSSNKLIGKRRTVSTVRERTGTNSSLVKKEDVKRSASVPYRRDQTHTSSLKSSPTKDKSLLRRQIYAVNRLMKMVEERKWELLRRGASSSTTTTTYAI